MAATRTPVAIGSSVPAWPIARTPSARRSRRTTSWLVGPRGLSMTRTPPSEGVVMGQRGSTEPYGASLGDGPIEHRLDRGAHALGQPPDQDLVVRRGLGVSLEIDRLAEENL